MCKQLLKSLFLLVVLSCVLNEFTAEAAPVVHYRPYDYRSYEPSPGAGLRGHVGYGLRWDLGGGWRGDLGAGLRGDLGAGLRGDHESRGYYPYDRNPGAALRGEGCADVRYVRVKEYDDADHFREDNPRNVYVEEYVNGEDAPRTRIHEVVDYRTAYDERRPEAPYAPIIRDPVGPQWRPAAPYAPYSPYAPAWQAPRRAPYGGYNGPRGDYKREEEYGYGYGRKYEGPAGDEGFKYAIE